MAAVTNRSPYTRFSTEGGGQLPEFEEGLDGQYRVNQWLFESAAMYNGFSWHQEFHWKQIQDKVEGDDTFLYGNFFQFGYFFHHWFQRFPREMEVFTRYAIYDPDTDLSGNFREEIVLGAN